MDTFQRHVEALVALKNDRARKKYLEQHTELQCDEGARVLCRSAVALVYSDVHQARGLCQCLTVLSRSLGTELGAGYRDHAWGALYFGSGSDYRKAFLRWRRAIRHFDTAGRDDEVAITCSCGLQTLVLLDRLDLFWKWERRARLVFERNADRLRLARLRLNVGTMHFNRDEWRLAANAFESAYEDFIRVGATTLDTWVSLSNLSACYQSLGDLPRAAQLLAKARFASEDTQLHASVAYIDENIASVKYLQGELASALTFARSASHYSLLHGMQRCAGESALTEAEILYALCLPREAERRATAALSVFASLELKREHGKALMVIGLCTKARGGYRKALELYMQAKKLFEASAIVPSAQQAELHRAGCIFESGDHRLGATLARDLLDSVSSDPANPTALGCRILLSRVLLEIGELPEALVFAEAALSRVALLDRAPLEAEALQVFGRIHERSGNLKMARDAYLKCEGCIERIRRQLTPGELKTSFLSDKTDLYEDLFSVGVKLRSTPSCLFDFAEKAKSRTLAELLVRQLQSPWDSVRSPESAELLSLWKELRGAVRQIEELNLSADPSAARRVEDLRQRVAAAESATMKLVRGLSPSGTTSALAETLPNSQQVASCLPEETALIEFYFARGIIFAFCIARGVCELVELGSVRRAERLQRLAMFHLRTRPSLSEDAELQQRSLLAHLQELYKLLWSPLREFVDAFRIVVVPHGFLHQLPFHALFDGHQFLADRHVVTCSPSASVLHAARSRRSDNDAAGTLIIGSSDDNAPEISAEVHDIAEILSDSRVLLDGRATKSRLLEELPRARLIHIASHSSFSPGDPSASALRLCDGLLGAKEIQEMRLQADLVVLSGCETGRNVTRGSDEIIGLTQALLQAGARSAMVSLWKVDDHSTAAFMRAFYSQLRPDSDRAEALRNAQLIHREARSHPYFWAPFILIGDPEGSPSTRKGGRYASTDERWTSHSTSTSSI